MGLVHTHANGHTTTPLITADHISKKWPLPEGNGDFTVLENINLSVYPNEVMAILGRSGSGKSTMLRILAGLIRSTSGRVLTMGGKPLRGANADVAMVFQNFALLPWATVLDNVELGLKARGLTRDERRQRALKAIDMVGLDGFESAYPKELSGGMQQRVGFARAFVMQPQVLFMDEPFSALDVLTAENLRGEIADLWQAGTFPAKSVVIVTHNIEEAVLLADRLVLLGANPGRIRGEMHVRLPRPRNRNSPDFKSLVDYVYTIMTNPEMALRATQEISIEGEAPKRFKLLPHARAGQISGLLELLIEQGGKEDIPPLAGRLQLEVDDLLPILDAASLLGFASVAQGDVTVTETGRTFAETDILQSKELFRKQVMSNVPLVVTMFETLKDRDNKSARADYFLDMLSESYPESEALEQFETAVDWGRFAELFEYNADDSRLYLPDAPEAVEPTPAS